MAWYRCSCEFRQEISPRLGDTITSARHLHRSTRLDGTAAIVRMEEISDSLAADLASLDDIAQCRPAASSTWDAVADAAS